MPRSRFQNPNVVRLPLSNDDWVEVRERLSGAEQRKMMSAAFTSVRAEKDGDANRPTIGVDFSMLAISRMKTYLRDWSFRDDHDKPVKCTPDAIDALDEETFVEIDKALDDHVKATDDAKKSQAGGTPLSPAS